MKLINLDGFLKSLNEAVDSFEVPKQLKGRAREYYKAGARDMLRQLNKHNFDQNETPKP